MRKRMITPEFFSDDELVENLDMAGRMFYLGTWTVAEDSGVFLLSPLALKMKIFPGDEISKDQIQSYIDTLVSMGKVVPFESDGKTYGWLKNFGRHQRLDNPSAPTLPLPSWIAWVEDEKRHKSHYEFRPVEDTSATRLRQVSDKKQYRLRRVSTNRSKEKRREENKDKSIVELHSTPSTKNVPYQEIVDAMNEVCGTRFQHKAQATRRLIKARWNEGHTLDDFIAVINSKAEEWLTDERMCQYLRPQTLFAAQNFESYLNGLKSQRASPHKSRDDDEERDSWEQSGTIFIDDPLKYRPGSAPSIIGGEP